MTVVISQCLLKIKYSSKEKREEKGRRN